MVNYDDEKVNFDNINKVKVFEKVIDNFFKVEPSSKRII